MASGGREANPPRGLAERRYARQVQRLVSQLVVPRSHRHESECSGKGRWFRHVCQQPPGTPVARWFAKHCATHRSPGALRAVYKAARHRSRDMRSRCCASGRSIRSEIWDGTADGELGAWAPEEISVDECTSFPCERLSHATASTEPATKASRNAEVTEHGTPSTRQSSRGPVWLTYRR
jgi:hypothetical protein